MASRKKKVGESHVRLYAHELQCPAYRTLSTDARALLVEFRALWDVSKPNPNRIYMSVRQIRKRLGCGQAVAMAARDELLERGWIRLVTPGTVSATGTRTAAVYALTSEPDDPKKDGATAEKTFMRWRPPTTEGKSLVPVSYHLSTRVEYYTKNQNGQNPADSTQGEYYQPEKWQSLVPKASTQISYQGVSPGDDTPSLGKIKARLTVAAIFGSLVIQAIERGSLQ